MERDIAHKFGLEHLVEVDQTQKVAEWQISAEPFIHSEDSGHNTGDNASSASDHLKDDSFSTPSAKVKSPEVAPSHSLDRKAVKKPKHPLRTAGVTSGITTTPNKSNKDSRVLTTRDSNSTGSKQLSKQGINRALDIKSRVSPQIASNKTSEIVEKKDASKRSSGVGRSHTFTAKTSPPQKATTVVRSNSTRKNKSGSVFDRLYPSIQRRSARVEQPLPVSTLRRNSADTGSMGTSHDSDGKSNCSYSRSRDISPIESCSECHTSESSKASPLKLEKYKINNDSTSGLRSKVPNNFTVGSPTSTNTSDEYSSSRKENRESKISSTKRGDGNIVSKTKKTSPVRMISNEGKERGSSNTSAWAKATDRFTNKKSCLDLESKDTFKPNFERFKLTRSSMRETSRTNVHKKTDGVSIPDKIYDKTDKVIEKSKGTSKAISNTKVAAGDLKSNSSSQPVKQATHILGDIKHKKMVNDRNTRLDKSKLATESTLISGNKTTKNNVDNRIHNTLANNNQDITKSDFCVQEVAKTGTKDSVLENDKVISDMSTNELCSSDNIINDKHMKPPADSKSRILTENQSPSIFVKELQQFSYAMDSLVAESSAKVEELDNKLSSHSEPSESISSSEKGSSDNLLTAGNRVLKPDHSLSSDSSSDRKGFNDQEQSDTRNEMWSISEKETSLIDKPVSVIKRGDILKLKTSIETSQDKKSENETGGKTKSRTSILSEKWLNKANKNKQTLLNDNKNLAQKEKVLKNVVNDFEGSTIPTSDTVGPDLEITKDNYPMFENNEIVNITQELKYDLQEKEENVHIMENHSETQNEKNLETKKTENTILSLKPVSGEKIENKKTFDSSLSQNKHKATQDFEKSGGRVSNSNVNKGGVAQRWLSNAQGENHMERPLKPGTGLFSPGSGRPVKPIAGRSNVSEKWLSRVKNSPSGTATIYNNKDKLKNTGHLSGKINIFESQIAEQSQAVRSDASDSGKIKIQSFNSDTDEVFSDEISENKDITKTDAYPSVNQNVTGDDEKPTKSIQDVVLPKKKPPPVPKKTFKTNSQLSKPKDSSDMSDHYVKLTENNKQIEHNKHGLAVELEDNTNLFISENILPEERKSEVVDILPKRDLIEKNEDVDNNLPKQMYGSESEQNITNDVVSDYQDVKTLNTDSFVGKTKSSRFDESENDPCHINSHRKSKILVSDYQIRSDKSSLDKTQNETTKDIVNDTDIKELDLNYDADNKDISKSSDLKSKFKNSMEEQFSTENVFNQLINGQSNVKSSATEDVFKQLIEGAGETIPKPDQEGSILEEDDDDGLGDLSFLPSITSMVKSAILMKTAGAQLKTPPGRRTNELSNKYLRKSQSQQEFRSEDISAANALAQKDKILKTLKNKNLSSSFGSGDNRKRLLRKSQSIDEGQPSQFYNRNDKVVLSDSEEEISIFKSDTPTDGSDDDSGEFKSDSIFQTKTTRQEKEINRFIFRSKASALLETLNERPGENSAPSSRLTKRRFSSDIGKRINMRLGFMDDLPTQEPVAESTGDSSSTIQEQPKRSNVVRRNSSGDIGKRIHMRLKNLGHNYVDEEDEDDDPLSHSLDMKKTTLS